MKKSLIRSGISAGVLVVLGLLGLLLFTPWAYIHNYELGYVFDSRNGTIHLVPHKGYIARTPIFESVYTIDLRPRQVCINVGSSNQAGGDGPIHNSANQRVLNCKLVRFNPAGLGQFVEWHGANDYSGDDLDDLLKIYAYDGSGRTYPFLTVLRELKDDGAPPVGTVAPTPVQ